MPKSKRKTKRNKKSFFKIKEKLVIIAPKKFVGRKLIGVICLFLGSLILASSTIYFFIIPKYFSSQPNQPETEKIIEQKIPFVPNKILIPHINFSSPVINGEIIIKIPAPIVKTEKGEEIYLFNQGKYQMYLVINSQIMDGNISNKITMDNRLIELFFQLPDKKAKYLIINAEQVE